MKFAAVILAGGASRRMGSPKALLPYAGETFADRLTGIFSEVCERVVLVVGHHAAEITAGIRRPATVVYNPDHEHGQLTSLQCGLRAAGEADAIFFTPVDYPAVHAETVRTLAASFDGRPVVPVFEGQHGHPVLIPSAVAAELLALPADGMAREVIHRHAASTLYVVTRDPGILRDADYPADLAALPRVTE